MAEPYNYLGLMGGTAALDSIPSALQSALLGRQQAEQNEAILAQGRRADKARQATAEMVLGSAGIGQPTAPQGSAGNGLVETADQEAASAAFRARFPNAPQYADPSERDAELLRIIAQADPAAAQAIIQGRRLQAAKAEVMRNPTAANIGRFGMQYPEAFKELKPAWDMLDGVQRQSATKFFADIYGYLSSGDTDGAISAVQRHIDAEKAAGGDTSEEEAFLATIRNNSTAARALAGLNLSLGMGPDKFADAFKVMGEDRRADETQPYEVRKSAAEARTAEVGAEFAPKKAASELATAAAQRDRWSAQTANEQADIALRRSGLDLERDKLQSTIQLELEKLDRSGTQLDANGRTAVNQAVGESTAASALADRMNNLADRMKGQGMGWGWMSSAREAWKGAFGSQDPISGLRSEYNQLVNAQAVKNLPPGPASDKDIALAKQGFPPANASGEYLQSFLRGMAKMQNAVAAAADRKANWIAANGSLAPSRRDIDVGGVMVPAGTTFTEFNGNAVKRGRQGETPASLDGILRKYGGR